MAIAYQPGDVVVFHGTNLIAKAIEFATGGPSHCGIVSTLDDKVVLVESTSLCKHPCLVAGKTVMGVQVHDIGQRLADYHGQAHVYRCLPAWSLDHDEQEKLRAWLFWFVDNHSTYDFGRAVLSATKLRRWFCPDADTQFCSELCAGALMRLSRFPLSDPALYTPGKLVKMMLTCGVFEKLACD